MHRRAVLFAMPALCLAGRAAAAEEAQAKQVGQYVDLQPVGLPIVVDGQLVNYVFISVRLILAPNADTPRWRAKEPVFRDALVRAGYATPFVLPGEYEKLDVARLSQTLMRTAASIAGPGVVRAVVVTSQVPSRRARPPRT
jgi:hypothetical protein